MIDVLSLFKQVLTLVLMLIPGIVIYKMKVGEGFPKGLSNLILYFAQPAMIIAPFIRPFDRTLLPGMIGVFVFSFLAHPLYFLLTRFMYKKCEDGMARALRFSIVFSNAGYMGIPLVEAVLGSAAAIYITVYCVSFNAYLWSLGGYIYTGERKYVTPKKIFINPSMLAIYAALLLFFLPIDGFVPQIAISVIDMLKSLVAPLSMMLVGYHMATANLREHIANKNVWGGVIARLLCCPLLVFAFMKAVSLLSIYHNEMAAAVMIIAASTPAATATSMFAERHSGDTKTAGVIVPLTTVLAVASMPLCALLMKLY